MREPTTELGSYFAGIEAYLVVDRSSRRYFSQLKSRFLLTDYKAYKEGSIKGWFKFIRLDMPLTAVPVQVAWMPHGLGGRVQSW